MDAQKKGVFVVLWNTLVVLASLFTMQVARAAPPESVYDLPKIVALQNRTFHVNHGLNFTLGFLPADAFNKGITIGTSYTYYITDFVAWEVANINYSFNSETDLKKQLAALGYTVENSAFAGQLDFVTYYVTTNILYTPLYNKNLAFNRSVVHGETSFIAGVGLAQFNYVGYRGLLSFGLMQRFFFDEESSMTLEFRENIHFDPAVGPSQLLEIKLGYTFQFSQKVDVVGDEEFNE
jgi:outer membrane beta-barrel protein